MESGVIDVNDSSYSLDDYSKYGFQDSDPKEPVEIRTYLQTEMNLPTGHDIGMFEEAQRFIRRRGRFLRRRGDLSAWEIEGLISREWRRKAAQRLNQEYDPIDRGTYLDSLLADYDSDLEEADETAEAPLRMPSKDAPMEEPIKQSPVSSSSLPPLPPRGTILPRAHFSTQDVRCARANILIGAIIKCCYATCATRGFTGNALGRSGCHHLMIAGVAPSVSARNTSTVIEIKRATTTNRKQSKRSDFVTATVVNINQTSKFGKVQVQYAGEAGTRSVNLCTTRWRLPGVSEEGICYINELNEIVMLKEPKSWKAIQRIDDPIIREKWNEACRAEIQGLREGNTYKLVDRPSGVRYIPLVWVFKIKQPKVGEAIGR